ncbi:hypothetical protein BIW11_13555 [Tropilaelaps mercedesae]|uniref:Uncharacterized protein n=1 Tax=Tropilaelaps mercedesae TaxID=418985 RepID=A0A1V9X1X5_9ACAR|nr:hypothetical protein BIW11_13555 [Tropilaelaps mercedesae]
MDTVDVTRPPAKRHHHRSGSADSAYLPIERRSSSDAVLLSTCRASSTGAGRFSPTLGLKAPTEDWSHAMLKQRHAHLTSGSCSGCLLKKVDCAFASTVGRAQGTDALSGRDFPENLLDRFAQGSERIQQLYVQTISNAQNMNELWQRTVELPCHRVLSNGCESRHASLPREGQPNHQARRNGRSLYTSLFWEPQPFHETPVSAVYTPKPDDFNRRRLFGDSINGTAEIESPGATFFEHARQRARNAESTPAETTTS